MSQSSTLREEFASLRTIVTDLWSDGRGWLLTAVAVAWLLSIGVRLVFPALLPRIRAEFGFDLTTAGILLTGLWVAYAVTQLPGGLLGDRIGERNVLVSSIVVTIASLIAITLSRGAWQFFAGTIVFGLGTGLFATTRFTVLADVYPERGGTAIGISSAAGNLGTAVIPVVASVLAAYVGWRWGFGFAIPLLAIAGVWLWFVVPRRTSGETSAVDTLSLRTVRRVARSVTRRAPLLTAISMLLMSVIYQGFTSFYPTYLVVTKGFDESTAGVLFGLFFAAGIVVQPMAGGIGDRFGPKRALALFIGLTVLSLLAFPFLSGLAPLVLLTALMSTQLGFWPIAQSYIIDALPDDMQGTGFGLLRTAYLIIAAASPTVVGALGDRGMFDEAFLLLAGAGAATLALWAFLPPPEEAAVSELRSATED